MYNKTIVDNTMNELFEINLVSDFSLIKETLTRIGIPSVKDNTLYQSVHILKKHDKVNSVDRYYLVHFKQMFGLDGREYEMSEDDTKRLNRVADVLRNWGMVEFDKDFAEDDLIETYKVKILKYGESKDWTLKEKYPIGKYRKIQEVN